MCFNNRAPALADHAFLAGKARMITPHVAAVTMIDRVQNQIAVKIALERGEAVAGVVDRLRILEMVVLAKQVNLPLRVKIVESRTA